MIKQPVVLHLVDDTTAGGVMQVIDFLTRSEHLSKTARHDVLSVSRGKFGAVPKDVDMIVSHTVISWRTLPALIALRAGRAKTPIVHVEHSYTEGFVEHNVSRKARFTTLLKVGFSLFDRVVAVSHAQGQWMIENGLCSQKRLVIIPSCVDLSSFRAVMPTPGPIRTLGAIGRLDRQKGFDVLIEAFKEVADQKIRLVVTGQGPELDALKSLADGDTRISFAGYAADAADAYARVDAVIMPSRWEAFGLVALETLAAKRALLCAQVDGMSDHAAYGAQYIETATKQGLTDAIEGLVSKSEIIDGNAVREDLLRVETKALTAWSNLIAQVCETQGQSEELSA